MRGEAALLFPKDVTAAGARTLARELGEMNVKVLDTAENLVLVRFDRAARKEIPKASSLGVMIVDRVSPSQLQSLPEQSRRIATLWNWSLSNKGKRISDRTVQSLMKKLKLEIDTQGYVFDSMARKRLGRVDRGEEADEKGNWRLRHSRGWEEIPGWWGYWKKYSTRTRTYVDQALTQRLVSDHIIAELDGPSHYEYQSRTNASSAFVYDWDYIWVWEEDWCEHWSYARNGNSSAQITGRTGFQT